MIKTNATNEERFWNDPHNIAWFRDEKTPSYWVEFFQKVDRNKVNRVLDLGCGAGRVTEMLIDLNFDVYACDSADGMVSETIKRIIEKFPRFATKERIINASMLKLPYVDSFFDCVVSNGVYHNAWSENDLESALKETSRVLRTGGYVCFNLFTSNFIAPEFKNIGGSVYLTEEGLHMTLTSVKSFLEIARRNKLRSAGDVTEYLRKVSTGQRSVARGVLIKN